MTRITVCALTFKRPDGLSRLLEGLNGLVFAAESPDVRLVIVDNDPQCSAEAIVDRWRPTLKWPVRYCGEARRGIAFARNAALDAIEPDTDFASFIDDDEVPEPDWLDALWRVQRTHDADVVGGPVVPHFPDAVPDWIVEGGFFNQRRYPTGTRLGHAFTNNVLFRWDIVGELNLRFEERFALMGCEDRHFFQRIRMAGRSVVWADDAVVTEWIPASRANTQWLIQRMYRVGNSTAFVELDLTPGFRTRAILAAKAIVWQKIGVLNVLGGLIGGTARRVRGRQFLAYGTGMFSGLADRPYEEYKKAYHA